MTSPQRTDARIAVIMLTVGTLIAIGGCSQSHTANLPKKQAQAVEALEALGASVTIRDDQVTFIDFYPMRETAAAIVHLEPFVELKKINFSSTELTDDQLEHLAPLIHLEELALTNTQITDAGLKHLAGLSKLILLNLDNNSITDAGLVHLKDLTHLKRLHLNKTKISDAGLVHLTGLADLEWLLAYDTQVTLNGAAVLRQSLPDLEVVAPEIKEEPADAEEETPQR